MRERREGEGRSERRGEGEGRGGVVFIASMCCCLITLLSCCCVTSREARLGHDGSESVKQHAFFRTDKWNWEVIRRCPAPFIPEIVSDEDTEYFDEIDPDKGQAESFPPATVRTHTTHAPPLHSLTLCLSLADLLREPIAICWLHLHEGPTAPTI